MNPGDRLFKDQAKELAATVALAGAAAGAAIAGDAAVLGGGIGLAPVMGAAAKWLSLHGVGWIERKYGPENAVAVHIKQCVEETERAVEDRCVLLLSEADDRRDLIELLRRVLSDASRILDEKTLVDCCRQRNRDEFNREVAQRLVDGVAGVYEYDERVVKDAKGKLAEMFGDIKVSDLPGFNESMQTVIRDIVVDCLAEVQQVRIAVERLENKSISGTLEWADARFEVFV